MEVLFLPEASEDINRLYQFLSEKNLIAAQKAMLAINESLDLLIENPMLGLEMDDRPQYRQLFIPFGKEAYVLRYRIEGNMLVVIKLWHSREKRS